MKTKKIVVLGSCNTDMVIKSDRLPVPGETILGGEFIMNPGGKGANQAVAAARLGGNVVFLTKTGNDLFGRQSVSLYSEENINTDYILSSSDKPSGVAMISVDKKGENSIIVASGANSTYSIDDFKSVESTVYDADILLMQLEIPIETVTYAAKVAKEHGVKVVLNPAPAQFLPKDLLENVSIIIPNNTEAEILSGIKVSDIESAKNATDIISQKGIETVIITMGDYGAFIKTKEEYISVPTQKVNAIDTTAAGDTFCGALVVALSEGKDIIDAVKFANKCSGITVTRLEAQSSCPYRNEII